MTISCKSDSSKADEGNDQSEQSNENNLSSTENQEPIKRVLNPNDILNSWVDKLNIRSTPDLKGKVITSVYSKDDLIYTGKQSEKPTTIVLRGGAYKDHWLNIKTPEGKEGWVFGGAVKLKDEEKGNDPISDESFYFAHFGKYDLKDWHKQGTIDESGGDAEIKTTTYNKGLNIVEISKVDVGDYGYGTVHKLYNDQQLIRERNFNFMADVNYRELVEIVKDYSQTPPVKHMRSQKLDIHPVQMNALPIMALGKWETTELKENQPNKKAVINDFSFEECKVIDSNSGCSCDFRRNKDNYKNNVFVTNLGTKDSGCLNIDGKMVTVTGRRIDDRQELYDNSFEQYWIEHKEREGTFVFGKKSNLDDYDAVRLLLVNTLLVMDKLPKEIPISTKGTVGMGKRSEYKSMAEEALKIAKEEKRKGSYGPPIKMEYKNALYTVIIDASVIGYDDGGGEQYEGQMTIKKKNGTWLEIINVWGGCGC